MSASSGFSTVGKEVDLKSDNRCEKMSMMPNFMQKYAHRSSIQAIYRRIYDTRTERVTASSPVAEYIRRPVTPFDTVTWKSSLQFINSDRDFQVPLRKQKSRISGLKHICENFHDKTNEILLAGIEDLNRCTTVRQTFDSYRRTLDKYYKLGNGKNVNLQEHHDSKKNVTTQTGTTIQAYQNKAIQVDFDKEEKVVVQNIECQTDNQLEPTLHLEIVNERNSNNDSRNLLGWGWRETTEALTRGALFGLREFLHGI
jgi:hypothetical protein